MHPILRLSESVKKKKEERKGKIKNDMEGCYNTLDKIGNMLIAHIIIYASHTKVLFVPVA